ncbi:MAG: 50S ribosomal protein L25 [Planctomycetes bacterium]|nr:50S ribosomal protein L25 [Planctomycetota bacterium]
MELQNLAVSTRSERGKGAGRRARALGMVPAILYGDGKDSVVLTVDGKTLDLLLRGKQGAHAIVQLDIADNPDLSGPAMVKDVQHHPVRGQVIHADFMRIDMTKKIRTSVAIKIEGRAAGVIEGGLLDHQLREVEVECLALDVPEYFAVDVSAMEIGDSLPPLKCTDLDGQQIDIQIRRTVKHRATSACRSFP